MSGLIWIGVGILVSVGILFGARAAAGLFLISVGAFAIFVYQAINQPPRKSVKAAKILEEVDRTEPRCGPVWNDPPKGLKAGDVAICDGGKWRIDTSARAPRDFFNDPAFASIDGNKYFRRTK